MRVHEVSEIIAYSVDDGVLLGHSGGGGGTVRRRSGSSDSGRSSCCVSRNGGSLRLRHGCCGGDVCGETLVEAVKGQRATFSRDNWAHSGSSGGWLRSHSATRTQCWRFHRENNINNNKHYCKQTSRDTRMTHRKRAWRDS